MIDLMRLESSLLQIKINNNSNENRNITMQFLGSVDFSHT